MRAAVSLLLLLLAPALRGEDCSAWAGADPSPWRPHPRSAQAQIQTLQGDPAEPGLFRYRLRLAPGARLPAHRHDAPLSATLLCGQLLLWRDGRALAEVWHPGGFVRIGADEVHAEGADRDTLIEVSGVGPLRTLAPP